MEGGSLAKAIKSFQKLGDSASQLWVLFNCMKKRKEMRKPVGNETQM